MTSTRLPGKVLLRLRGKTELDYHLDRLAVAGVSVDITTTANSSDDPTCDVAESPFQGSETDVLGRFIGCIEHYNLNTIVRVTSDCPLIDGTVVAAELDCFAADRDGSQYRLTFDTPYDFSLIRQLVEQFDVDQFSMGQIVDLLQAHPEFAAINTHMEQKKLGK